MMASTSARALKTARRNLTASIQRVASTNQIRCLAASTPFHSSYVDQYHAFPTPCRHFHASTQRWEQATAAATTDDGSSADAATSEEEIHPTDIMYDLPASPPLSPESQQKVEELFNKIQWLDMMEVHLLTQLVHERMGGTWSDLDSVGGGPVRAAQAGSADGGEAEEEANTLKEVKLMGFDAKSKIKVVKEVRAIAGLGLKEAKELVESAPKVLSKDLTMEKAEELKAQLEAVGAEVEIV